MATKKTNQKTVTRFMDMFGGGYKKTAYEHIYIDAPKEQAKKIFEETLGVDPDTCTCDCCGEDFAIDEYDSIEYATAYDRACPWSHDKNNYDLDSAQMSVVDYLNQDNVLFIISDK